MVHRNESSEQPKKDLSLEQQAELIEQRLKKLENKCSIPEKRKSIEINPIVMIMRFMAKHLGEDKGQLFENGFIGHLQIIQRVTVDQSNDFAENFQHLTEMLCNLCVNKGLRWKFVDRLLSNWLQCLETLPKTLKYNTFSYSKANAFKNCVQFIAEANCISAQFTMLDILCSYMEGSKNPRHRLCSTIDHILNIKLSTLDKLSSIESTPMTFDDKHWLLRCINKSRSCQLIFGERIKSVQFGDSVTIEFQENGMWLYLNKPAKTIEFWMTYESIQTKVTISARILKNVQMMDSDSPWIANLRFILDAAPKFESNAGNRINPPECQVNIVDVAFDTGFRRNHLDKLIPEMFNIRPEMMTSPDAVVSELEDDSDLQMIKPVEVQREDSPKRPSRKRSSRPSERNEAIEVINVDEPSKTTQKAKKPRQRVTNYLKASSPVIELDDDDEVEIVKLPPKQLSASKPMSAYQIPSTSFYGKPSTSSSKNNQLKPPVVGRKRRAAAEKALGGIQRSLDDSMFEFDGENEKIVAKKKPKKMPAPPKWPELNITHKRSHGTIEGRKLWTNQQDDTIHSVESTPIKKPSIKCADTDSNIELTPASFKSSFFMDPKRQQNRIIENMQKINEIIEHKQHEPHNPNVSFSYRSFAKNESKQISRHTIKKTPDSTIAYEENIDVNANKQCQCVRNHHIVENELKNITESANRALVTLDSNKQACRCGHSQSVQDLM